MEDLKLKRKSKGFDIVTLMGGSRDPTKKKRNEFKKNVIVSPYQK